MAQNGFLIRKQARAELASRWPPAEDFSVDAPADSRKAKLQELCQRWEAEQGTTAEVLPTAAAVPLESSSLAQLLTDLKAADVQQRRRAADRLAQQAAKSPLTDEALETICPLVIADADALVWRSILSAVDDNGSELTVRLAYAGLSHPAAEVRRRACEHLRKHPDAGHAEVLVKSLADADSSVVRSALLALSASKAKLDPAPVHKLLSATDKTLRVDAAQCLMHLGDAGGQAALERLAHDDDPAVRRQAAMTLGRGGDETALPVLMGLLDDQGGVREAALSSLAQIAGKDMARVGHAEPPTNSTEEVRRWRAWYATRR